MYIILGKNCADYLTRVKLEKSFRAKNPVISF